MKRLLLSILLGLNTLHIFAQNTDFQYPAGSIIPVETVYNLNPKLPANLSTETLKSYLNSVYLSQNPTGQTFELEYIKQSPAGKHIRFKHTYLGLPVFQSQVLVNISPQGQVYCIVASIVKPTKVVSTSTVTKATMWVNTFSGLTPAFMEVNSEGYGLTKIFSTDLKLITQYPTKLYLHGPDTMVSAMVFMPNPIVSQNVNYGGNFADNNDKTNPDLNNARKKVRMGINYQNGKFAIKSGYLALKDVASPNDPITVPTDTFLNFTRDQVGFEDVNAYYHIYAMSQYLKKGGFTDQLDSIRIDAHGSLGDDNSAFNPGRYPYEIEYGTGGVDDGEDGQVVVHEFGHSLSYLASPGTSFGNERNSMEEGQADYIGMSYSNSISRFKGYDVFSWDGHNDIWDGFNAKTKLQYKDLSGFKDVDRNLWSTALMCVYDILGRTKTDSLILSYYFLQAGETTMPQMASVILKMDTVLFNGRHVADIWQCFTDRGFLDTVPWYLTKITPLSLPQDISVQNSSGFSLGISSLDILVKYPNFWQGYEIINQMGQTLLSRAVESKITLNPSTFVNGIYYLRITAKDGQTVFNYKLIRY
jgi:hypothetical protein